MDEKVIEQYLQCQCGVILRSTQKIYEVHFSSVRLSRFQSNLKSMTQYYSHI